jgi:16S rRNA G966 N2-methylase RsmD
MAGNCLYYGDNLVVLRYHIKDESIDLVYLDPPFNGQLMTVAELLDGTTLDLPTPTGSNTTFKRAPKHSKKGAVEQDLFG